MASFNIHGERIVDGNAGTLTVLTLYEAGSPDTTRTLVRTEKLHITDVHIITEDAGDVSLVADSAAAGRYIVQTKTAAGIPIDLHFHTPYICPSAVIPKFSGPGANRSQCTIQGFIREA